MIESKVLRKRAERTAVEEDTHINWDDEEEPETEESISEELQVKINALHFRMFLVNLCAITGSHIYKYREHKECFLKN